MVSVMMFMVMFAVVFAVVSRTAARRTGWDQQQLGNDTRREIERLRESLADVSSRLHQLEQERDFYMELLEGRKDIPKLTDGSSSDPER